MKYNLKTPLHTTPYLLNEGTNLSLKDSTRESDDNIAMMGERSFTLKLFVYFNEAVLKIIKDCLLRVMQKYAQISNYRSVYNVCRVAPCDSRIHSG